MSKVIDSEGNIKVTGLGSVISQVITDGVTDKAPSENAVFDALANKVPYTGATNDVNLGVHDLTATQGTFATSGNPDTLTVNHSSGSGKALTITKGGNGEGVYVNKTSGSGNAVTVIGDLEATNLKRTGGTSSQFLKANGSVDSTSYQPTLVSATNIKTVNGNSLLGSGDLVVGGGITVGTTAVTSGTVGRVFFQGTGDVVQQSASFTTDGVAAFQIGNNTTGIVKTATENLGGVSVATLRTSSVNDFSLVKLTGIFVSTFVDGRVGVYRGANEMIVIQAAAAGGYISGANHLNVGFGVNASSGARLDVRAQGALSTDIALRVRNSADTANILEVRGNTTWDFPTYLSGAQGGVGSEVRMGNAGTFYTQANQFHITGSRIVSGAAQSMLATSGSQNVLFSSDLGGGTTQIMLNFRNGHIHLGGVLGDTLTGTNVLGIANGTAPTASFTDRYLQYSADIVAGNAAPHFRTENGNIIKLYQNAAVTSAQGIANALTNLGVLASSTIAASIPTHDGATYDTNAIQTLTAAEYAAITPNASTLYFIV